MSEQHNFSVLGKVKLVLARLTSADPWEILSINFWYEGFDYDLSRQSESYAMDILRDTAIMGECYSEILDPVALPEGLQVFELVGELHHENWQSWTDCGYEHDCREWLEKDKFREIKGEDLEWFKEEDPERWSDFMGDKDADVGNG